MGEIADLWASIGARVNQRQWRQADDRIAGTRKAVDGLSGAFAGAFQDKAGRWRAASGRFLTMKEKAQLAAAGVAGVGDAAEKAGRKAAVSFGGAGRLLGMFGAYMGGRALYGGLVQFNATAEETRIQLAGMMALAKRTNLSDEVRTADRLYGNLQRRAASLPGTTAEYVQMAGKIARVVTDAKGSVQDLEDMTVNAVVAGKGLGEQWEVVARDIEQALMGRYNTTDPFLSKILPSIGYKGEEGRDKWRALSAEKRLAEMRRALLQKQVTQLGEAQGQSFSGRLSQLKDQVGMFFGAIGKPLFEALKGVLENINVWLEENKEAVAAAAETVGVALVGAFQALGVVFGVVAKNMDVILPILIGLAGAFVAVKIAALAAWLAVSWPVVLIGAAIAAVIALIVKMRREPERVKSAFRSLWQTIKNGASSLWEGFRAFISRIVKFFVEDVPNAIKSALTAAFDFVVEHVKAAFSAAFEFIRGLPVVKQIFDAIAWARDKMGDDEAKTASAGARGGPWNASSPSLASAGAAGGVSVGGVNISVSSPNADPQAVAVEVGRVFDERWSSILRQTQDVVG